ncbi:MAG: Vps62-related protein [Nannocystaceae bacterium]
MVRGLSGHSWTRARARALAIPGLLAALGLACAGDDQGDSGATTGGATSTSGDPSGDPSEGTTTEGTAGTTSDGGTASGSATQGTTAATTDAGTTTDGTTTTSTTTSGESTTDDSTTGVNPPDPRQVLLETYAPRVWFPADEEYFPSTVEHSFAHTTRFADGEGKHWIRTIEPLESPSDTLPFFAGDLEGAPVYAYYADKDAAGVAPGFVDLVYFFYYPYNRGKEVVDTIWGNHVGDWEHITVRLKVEVDLTLTPVQVYLSAHSFGGVYEWADVERFGDTHPVVYSAWGSHGVWSGPGDHVYQTIGEEVWGVCVTLVCTDLTDNTSAGIPWDTWEDVAGMDYFAQEGIAGTPWPAWMSDQYTDPGPMPADVPGKGPIYRWGNEEDCSTLGVDISDLIGVCRLEDGPTGPVSKDVWGAELL